MAIVWFSDEDRQRMLDEHRTMRVWSQFQWEWALEHYKEADSTPLTAAQLRVTDRLSLAPLDPRERLHRRDERG